MSALGIRARTRVLDYEVFPLDRQFDRREAHERRNVIVSVVSNIEAAPWDRAGASI